MRRRLLALLLPCLLLVPVSAAEKPADPDVEFLRQAGVATDDAGLLAYLRKFAERDDDLANLDQLVRQLGDAKQARREEASKKLCALGLVALPALRKATKDRDQEVSRRARAAIDDMCRKNEWALIGAAARRLLKTAPAETAAALLAVLPYAVDEGTEETIWFGLDALAVRDGKVRDVLFPALKDRSPARRALAACLLARLGDGKQKEAAKALLVDADATVRLRAAQGSLAAKDKAAIPVLIGLLAVPATEIAWQAEELLHCVAGDESPCETVGAGGSEGQKKCQGVWGDWWRRAGKTLDLCTKQLCPTLLLLCETVYGKGAAPSHHIWLSGCDGKPRWRLTGLDEITCVQPLSGGRLLIGEYGAGAKHRVRERNLHGEVIWEKELDNIWGKLLNCQRLVDGSTFIATDNQIIELTRSEQSRYTLRTRDIAPHPKGVRRLGTGLILCWNMQGVLATVAPGTGKVIKRFKWCAEGKDDFAPHYGLEPLPGGSCLVAVRESDKHRVIEVDEAGKAVWQRELSCVTSAQRLSGGIFLIGSSRFGCECVVEIDRQGKAVWEAFATQSGNHLHHPSPCLSLVRLGFSHNGEAAVDVDSLGHRIRLLQDKDPIVRVRACKALAELGPKAAPAIPLLIKLLADRDEEMNREAAAALRAVGTVALPEAVKASKDERPEVRLAAMWTLGLYGREGEAAVSALRQGLTDKSPKVRQCAARSLGLIGPGAKAAVPDLLGLLKNEKEAEIVRGWSANALGMIGSTDAPIGDALIEALRDGRSPLVQGFAALALGRIGPNAKKAVLPLIEVLKAARSKKREETARLRQDLITALGLFGPEARTAVPTIVAELNDRSASHEQRATAAVESLAKIGGPDALRALSRAAKDETLPTYLQSLTAELLKTAEK